MHAVPRELLNSLDVSDLESRQSMTATGTFTPNWPNQSTAKPGFKGIMIQKGASKGGYGFFISNAKDDGAPESGGVILGLP